MTYLLVENCSTQGRVPRKLCSCRCLLSYQVILLEVDPAEALVVDNSNLERASSFGIRSTKEQLAARLETLGLYVKLAVDVKWDVAAGGGGLHADCEPVLLEDGSRQEDIWGANWIPETQEIHYEALMNIRPSQDNRSMTIQDPSVRERVAEVVVVRRPLGGV